ncbi:hypothetical protein LY76DRAFT_169259 [Colletotrichum caudatum]|nr:hypothetical protein LY76DRAFT_169259 [Colletotrichum caudatum]
MQGFDGTDANLDPIPPRRHSKHRQTTTALKRVSPATCIRSLGASARLQHTCYILSSPPDIRFRASAPHLSHRRFPYGLTRRGLPTRQRSQPPTRPNSRCQQMPVLGVPTCHRGMPKFRYRGQIPR